MSLVQLEGHEDVALAQILEPVAISDTNVAPNDVAEESPKSVEAEQETVAEAPKDDPPEYEAAGFLRPMTAEAVNDRYRTSCGLYEPMNVTISPGVYNDTPAYLPQGWVSHVHPEGARYFVNADKKVVTDSDIQDTEVFDLIDRGIVLFDKLAEGSDVPLSEDRELYIRAVTDEDDAHCRYYFVDHSCQKEAWLHEIDSDDLDICRILSKTHLSFTLREHYWTHIEFFPHRRVDEPVRQEFIARLRHGHLDQLTSLSSTFPYTAQQCEAFLGILAVPEELADNRCLTTSLARVAGNIVRVDGQIFFGESFARLDRTAYRIFEPNSAYSRLLSIASALVMKRDEALTSELNECFPDRTAIGCVWTALMKRMLKVWALEGASGFAAFSVTLMGILPSAHPGGLTIYMALPTLVVSGSAALTAGSLVFKYLDSAEDSAMCGLGTMLAIEHETYGFQPVAIWWSVPRALATYSASLLALVVVSLVAEVIHPGFIVAGIAVSSVALTAILFLLKDPLSVKISEAWDRVKTWKEGRKLSLPEDSAV